MSWPTEAERIDSSNLHKNTDANAGVNQHSKILDNFSCRIIQAHYYNTMYGQDLPNR